MPNVPLSTRFVGFAPETNLQERKSANINALSQPFTMQDIANTVGGASAPVLTYVATGGIMDGPEVIFYNTSVSNYNGGTGTVNVQTYNAPYITFYSTITPVTSLSFPGLEALINLRFQGDVEVTSLSLPDLRIINEAYNGDIGFGVGIDVQLIPELTTVYVPNIEFCLSHDSTVFRFSDCENLTDVTLGTVGTLKVLYNSIVLNNCALNSTSVTRILNVLISLDGTNGTTEWGDGSALDILGGTNAVPSESDLVKIATLEARGATVYYNS
jgi:hypothetical protein